MTVTDMITLTAKLKDRVVNAIANEFDEFAPGDADKVREVPVGARIPMDIPETRMEVLADEPDTATGEELVVLACDHFGIYPG